MTPRKRVSVRYSKNIHGVGGTRGFVVTIDGPAGAGKSTVSRKLAEELGGRLLDTGAMYRCVAYFAAKRGAKSEKELGVIAKGLKFDIDDKTQHLTVNGEDLGNKLRTQRVSDLASKVSRVQKVREILTRQQRRIGRAWSRKFPVVVEGRDIGTVVFPKVDFKFFVTASPEVRAERRFQQLKKQGVKRISFRVILKENIERDYQDSHRKLAPLKCAEDAVVVDTSSMGISQVVHFMVDHIRNRLALLQTTHRS